MRILNSASRRRSAVGRMAFDFGAVMARPRSAPPTTRITSLAGAVGADRRRDPAIGVGRAGRLYARPACVAGLAPARRDVPPARDGPYDRRGDLRAVPRP